jgi:predicted DNA-binding transcriptional regulator AlpA
MLKRKLLSTVAAPRSLSKTPEAPEKHEAASASPVAARRTAGPRQTQRRPARPKPRARRTKSDPDDDDGGDGDGKPATLTVVPHRPVADRDEGQPHPMRLYRTTRLANLFGVDASTIWRWRKAGVLPPPIQIGGVHGWTEAQLQPLMQARLQAGE